MKLTTKIVISDLEHADITEERRVFDQNSLTVDWRDCRTEAEVIEGCQDADILLVQYAAMTRKAIESLPNLKHIIRYGVGVDTVDLAAAAENGIEVSNVPDYGMHDVADHAVAHTLNLHRKIYMANKEVKEGKWDYISTIPIKRMSHCVVGVIGFGRIGQEYAKRMRSFGCTIIAYDPFLKKHDDAEMVILDELFMKSDIISIHCPAEGNIDLISDDALAKMKDGILIINVARGGVVNEEALEDALTSKKVGGYGTDVAKIEPIPMASPLLKHENVIITPHMAWYSEEAAQELKRKAAEEAVRFAKGEKVYYSVIKSS